MNIPFFSNNIARVNSESFTAFISLTLSGLLTGVSESLANSLLFVSSIISVIISDGRPTCLAFFIRFGASSTLTPLSLIFFKNSSVVIFSLSKSVFLIKNFLYIISQIGIFFNFFGNKNRI